MSAEEMLRNRERSATNTKASTETPFTSNVTGVRENVVLSGLKKHKSLGAVGLITLILVILAVVFSFGNLIPAAILERLVEATDVQYADAVESKFLVFQQALRDGDVPDNTVERLKANGITVSGSTLEYKGETVTAANFINKIHSDAGFYNAFNAATYNRAAYYYDESAEAVFKKIGTSRNNYTESSSFDEVMSKLVGEGSNINVNTVGLMEKENEEGEKYSEYDTVGENANSGSENAEEFVKNVAKNNLAEDALLATLNATDALNVADTISKEQKSAIFFMALMENISKMKAGEGNTSKINEAMNFLYDEKETSVVDVKTGETVKTKGTALDAPSLYAILSGTQIDGNKVVNYASDRVLKTVENKVGVDSVGSEVKEGTVTSTSTKLKGAIGRFLEILGVQADEGVLSNITPTINDSMIENDFESIDGVYAGELLVEGAVNIGKELAKASGATAGDAGAVQNYTKLGNTIAALDAEADRLNRSPFDITSRNTFLGSIVYRLGVSVASVPGAGGALTTMGTLARNVVGSAMKILAPVSKAEDEGTNYLANFGNCETIASIGAVGSVGCSEVATFDTSTLDDTFNDDKFQAFVEENTTMENGKRTIKKDSILADFIKFNNERITPIGVMDGGILESLKSGASKVPFLSNILSMIEMWLGATDEEKAVATGKSFVNSSSNSEWDTYKYAQRYVSLARATDALRQYDGDETAYNDIKFFEGAENPVVAFLTDYYNEVASN